jgi:hypothetical protein
MRIMTALALVTLFAVPARAERHDALQTTGTTRTAQLRADLQVTNTGRAATSAADVDHGPSALKPRDAGPLSGAMADMVERQMRKNVGSIDTCAAEATQRNPQAAGTINLAVVVSDRKVTTVAAADDTVKDAALTECLTKAAHAWTFSLKSAEFTWPVSLTHRR